MEDGTQTDLAGPEIHGFRTLKDLDYAKMKKEALTRWLRPNEIYALLCNFELFEVKVTPEELPESGRIIFYNRKLLKNFRKDGHNWKKKTDGKTVKEADKRLKVGDLDGIRVYYAHGQDNNFCRRIYSLLDEKLEHIVLVHYREISEDNATTYHRTPKECKEDLCLSDRMHHGSPVIPLNSHSGSIYSETPGSMVLSKEIDSGTDQAFCTGEISQQRLYGLGDFGSHDCFLPYDSSSAPGNLSITINSSGCPSANEPINAYFPPAGYQNVQSLYETIDTNFQKRDSETVVSGAVETSAILDHNCLQSQGSFMGLMKITENDSRGSLDELSIESPVLMDNGLASTIVMDQSPIQEAFCITKDSPAWAFSTEETKDCFLPYNSSSAPGNLSITINSSGSPSANEPINAYFPPVGYQNGQSLYETIDTNFQKRDSETVVAGAVETSATLDDNCLQSQDSFTGLTKIIENDSRGSLDELPIKSPVLTDNGLGSTIVMDESPIQEAFCITEVSPAWAFSTEETKVIVVGYFHEGHNYLMESTLYFVFGGVYVPAETVQVGVFRCMALPSRAGLVDFYLSTDGHRPISQVLKFEYRSVPTSQMNNEIGLLEDEKSKWGELQLQIKLAHLLFSTTSNIATLSSNRPANALKEAKKFTALTPSYEKNWTHFINLTMNKEISFSQANQNFFELTLKSKLQEWLLERVVEGHKTTPRDSKGQGVIHLCAMLGYAWTVYPFALSGLSLDFRDASGWTALHWAAYYGREKMVAMLLSLGANPSLVSDPTLKRPGGYTAADLASQKGHEGLAAYLAEKGLTAHLNAMYKSGKISRSLQNTATTMEVPENLNEEEQLKRDSFEACRTAAAAADHIWTALREHVIPRSQAAFRGRKILLFVGVRKKAILLHWRQKREGLKREGLCGLQAESAMDLGATDAQEDEEEDFNQISRNQAEERVNRLVVQVLAMRRSHQVQKEYRRMKLAFDQAKVVCLVEKVYRRMMLAFDKAKKNNNNGNRRNRGETSDSKKEYEPAQKKQKIQNEDHLALSNALCNHCGKVGAAACSQDHLLLSVPLS